MIIDNLSLSFGTEEIFRNVSLNIKEGEKVGIVGVNGAGKTTFFNVILGRVEADEGRVKLKEGARVGYLPQIITDEVDSEEDVFHWLYRARPIEKLTKELEAQYEKLNKSGAQVDKIYKKIDKIQKKLDSYNYYSAETELLKLIDGMKISDEVLDERVCDLSGGEKSKVAFARVLYSMPDVLLLDEPTNHLDEGTRSFIINYLKTYKGSVYVISHDIDFLNSFTTMILFIDKRFKTMELFNGNYDRFIKLEKEKEENINRIASKEEKEINKLQSIVDKYATSSGKRKKMAEDRKKKLDKLKENRTYSIKKEKEVRMSIDINKESSKRVLKVNNLYFRYNKNSKRDIIHDLSFEVRRKEKFLIVGENGVGKSTLLKIIVGALKQDSGEVILGNNTTIAYYAQEHEILDNEKSIFDNFSDIDISDGKLRSFLGGFLFYGDDVYKRVGVLSPGERSRVALAKIALSGANFLILDEPTNHLDPTTQKVIGEVFKTYKGTMLVVSHNPEFVDKLGIERILLLPSGNIRFYDRETVEYYENINTKDI